MSLYDLKDLLTKTNNNRGIINFVVMKLKNMTIEDIEKYKDDKEIFNYFFNILEEPELKENIELLLDYVTDKKIVYRRICGSFNTFKFFVNNLKKEGITLKEIEDSNFKDKLQKQIDSWLEEKCNNKENEEDINFLLRENVGANKEEALKLSVNKKHFESFKYLIKTKGADLEEIRQNNTWNVDNKLQEQLDNWLEEKCNNKENEEDIKFLLREGIGASKKIVYEKIKNSIDNPNFEDFKFFVNNLKKEGITLKEIEDSNFKDKLQKQIDSWLEKFCEEEKTNKLDTENINFLLDCGASKKIDDLREQLRTIRDDIAIQSTGRTVESRDLSRNSTWKPSKY